jgi:hypothetical protein
MPPSTTAPAVGGRPPLRSPAHTAARLAPGAAAAKISTSQSGTARSRTVEIAYHRLHGTPGYEVVPSDRWCAAHPDKLWTGVLVSADWDYPSLASDFGWDIRSVPSASGALCEHDGTDGTIRCGCGRTATDFITAAAAWLDDHEGDTADDPGYLDA